MKQLWVINVFQFLDYLGCHANAILKLHPSRQVDAKLRERQPNGIFMYLNYIE